MADDNWQEMTHASWRAEYESEPERPCDHQWTTTVHHDGHRPGAPAHYHAVCHICSDLGPARPL